jgi:hypothetical protein
MIEHLPLASLEALSSNPNTAKKKKKGTFLKQLLCTRYCSRHYYLAVNIEGKKKICSHEVLTLGLYYPKQ